MTGYYSVFGLNSNSGVRTPLEAKHTDYGIYSKTRFRNLVIQKMLK